MKIKFTSSNAGLDHCSRFSLLKKGLISTMLFLFLGSFTQLSAQDDNGFVRNNRWLVETGYNLISSIGSGGTGATLLLNDGETLLNLGFEVGKFTSENFAIKLKLGVLSASGGFSNITNFGAGVKYYIGGNVPFEIGGSILSGGGDSEFYANTSVGYAMNLADNVTLEPSLGGLVGNGEVVLNFRLGISLFL